MKKKKMKLKNKKNYIKVNNKLFQYLIIIILINCFINISN